MPATDDATTTVCLNDNDRDNNETTTTAAAPTTTVADTNELAADSRPLAARNHSTGSSADRKDSDSSANLRKKRQKPKSNKKTSNMESKINRRKEEKTGDDGTIDDFDVFEDVPGTAPSTSSTKKQARSSMAHQNQDEEREMNSEEKEKFFKVKDFFKLSNNRKKIPVVPPASATAGQAIAAATYDSSKNKASTSLFSKLKFKKKSQQEKDNDNLDDLIDEMVKAPAKKMPIVRFDSEGDVPYLKDETQVKFDENGMRIMSDAEAEAAAMKEKEVIFLCFSDFLHPQFGHSRFVCCRIFCVSVSSFVSTSISSARRSAFVAIGFIHVHSQIVFHRAKSVFTVSTFSSRSSSISSMLHRISYCFFVLHLRANSIRGYLSAIRSYCLRFGFSDPLRSTNGQQKFSLFTLLRAVDKYQKRPRPPRLPIDAILLSRLYRLLDRSYFDSYYDCLLRTAFLIAFFGFLCLI